MAKKKIKDVELDEELNKEDELEEESKKKRVKKQDPKKVVVVQPKRRKSKYERRKIIFKIAGWIMAVIMLVGSLAGIFGMLVYYNH